MHEEEYYGRDTQRRSAAPLLINITTKTPLSQTRQPGQRMREAWLERLARESHLLNWNEEQRNAAILEGVQDAVGSGNITTERSTREVRRLGRLATHPDVRGEFERLKTLRDVVWRTNRDLVRAVGLHGPSQLLADILKRQKEPHLRKHVASPDAYVRHLAQRLMRSKCR